MRRYPHILMAAGVAGALAVGLTAASAATAPGIAEAVATQYTVTRTYGPYNGALPITGPAGSVPDFEDAPSVACHNASDALLGGNAVVNLKTTGHPTAKNATLDLDRLGASWDPEDTPSLRWATWIKPTGKVGWNSVTLTITCLVRK